MTTVPRFGETQLRALANTMAEFQTHREISDVLSLCGMDSNIEGSKKDRLYAALSRSEERFSCGNKVIEYTQKSIPPSMFANRSEEFSSRRNKINTVLAFSGFHLREDGNIETVKPASTISEAQQRAASLRSEINRRGLHGEVHRFSRAELLDDNYFHAVLEAAKSLPERVRTLSGLQLDGHELYDTAFGTNGTPARVAVNARSTQSERSLHTGTVHLLKCLYSLFRNPVAHEPKITMAMTEDEALEALTMISFAHRKLDGAVTVPKSVVGKP